MCKCIEEITQKYEIENTVDGLRPVVHIDSLIDARIYYYKQIKKTQKISNRATSKTIVFRYCPICGKPYDWGKN